MRKIWLRVVGVFYVLQFLMMASHSGDGSERLPRPGGGGQFDRSFSNRHVGHFRARGRGDRGGIVADLWYALARGSHFGVVGGWLVVHSAVIVTGLRALADKPRAVPAT